MNELLMQAVVDLAAFLELSADEVVDPDAAIQQLEQLSSKLRQLAPSDRGAFIAFVHRAAERDPSRADFLRALPERLGLAPPAPSSAAPPTRSTTPPDLRIIAIDWSGAERGDRNHIWIAEAREQTVTMLECGRDRDGVVDWLLAQRARGGRAIVGLDFAFSFPEWFLDDQGWADAPAAWQAMVDDAEPLLSSCAPPFWGRPGRPNPRLGKAEYRGTEASLGAVSGIRAKSVFQIGGAGTVGTGSLRGMRALHRLHNAGLGIWPFTEPSAWTVIELYPRILTGPVNKSDAASRRAYLRRYPALAANHRDAAVGSEDAFDALVSALAMAAHVGQLAALSVDALDSSTRREGLIWAPRDGFRS